MIRFITMFSRSEPLCPPNNSRIDDGGGPIKCSLYRLSMISALLVVATVDAVAANHYVWCGAATNGNGVSLTAAYKDLPSDLTRGDTYYVAGDANCTYAPHTFNDAENGTLIIGIIKVTQAQSGIAGYLSTMAAYPAKWSIPIKLSPQTLSLPEWPICQGYYNFDGVTGSTDAIATPGGQGFVLEASGYLPQGHIYISSNSCGGGSKTFNSITLHHIEVRTQNNDNYAAVPVVACQYAGGLATITTVNPGWSQGWLAGDYVSGSTSNHLVSFGVSGSASPIASASGNIVTIALASSPCANLAFLELDIHSPRGVGGYAIYASYPGNVINGLDVQYCYLHNSGFDNIVYFNFGSQGAGSIIAHNFFTGNIGWPQSHGQPIETAGTSGLTIAYNSFIDGMGTAVVFNNSISGVDAHANNMAFYRNIVAETGSNPNNAGWTALIEDKAQAGCVAAGNSSIQGLLVYNNTIANTNAGAWDTNLGLIENANNCSSGWVAQNNLWYNSIHIGLGFPAISEDYNSVVNTQVAGWVPNTHDFQSNSGSANPFVSTSLNFNLSVNTGPSTCILGRNCLNDGVMLPTPYNVDIVGNLVGANQAFDRGAFQFAIPSNQPSNVQVIVQ